MSLSSCCSFLCYPESSTVRNVRYTAHIPLIVPSFTNVESQVEDQSLPTQVETPNSLVGEGFPPLPSKLVKRIEGREFMEMAELLPERLLAYTSGDDHTKASKSKVKPVTNILDWIQAFGLYVVIILPKQLQRVPDLSEYQALIIDAQQEYQGECWIGYDCTFRQRRASQPIEK